MRRLALPLCLLLISAPALAQERVGVRVGDHPGFGRVVFDWPRDVGFRVEQAEGRVTLRFAAPGAFETLPGRMPRNVTALRAAGESAEITIAAAARPRVYRLGNRIVLDVADPQPGAAAAAPPPATLAARAAPARPEPRPAPRNANAPRPAPAPAPPLPLQAAPVVPVETAALPAPGATPPAPIPPATPVAGAPAVPRPAPRPVLVRSLPGGGLAIPATAEIGAALFRRGDAWLLVLDAPLPLDLAPIAQHPVLGQVEVSRGASATTLRLPAAAFAAPTLRRDGPAWLLEAPNPPTALRSILPEVEPGPPMRLVLRSAAPAPNDFGALNSAINVMKPP